MTPITPQDLEALIAAEQHTQAARNNEPEGLQKLASGAVVRKVKHWPETLTLCCLTLCSGYTVVGKSACLNPAAYDAEMGRKLARQDAFNQLWALEGYHRMAVQAHAQAFAATQELAFFFSCGDSLEEVSRHLDLPAGPLREHIARLVKAAQGAGEDERLARARKLRLRGLAYSEIAVVIGGTTDEVRAMLVGREG